jgi:hypothetical protein
MDHTASSGGCHSQRTSESMPQENRHISCCLNPTADDPQDGVIRSTRHVILLLLSHLVLHSGSKTCIHYCGLVLFSLSQFTGPSASREPHCWWKWEGIGMKCSLWVKRMEGIFCGNFSSSQGLWPPCRNAWNADCYTSQGELPTFLTLAIGDELGNC